MKIWKVQDGQNFLIIKKIKPCNKPYLSQKRKRFLEYPKAQDES